MAAIIFVPRPRVTASFHTLGSPHFYELIPDLLLRLTPRTWELLAFLPIDPWPSWDPSSWYHSYQFIPCQFLIYPWEMTVITLLTHWFLTTISLTPGIWQLSLSLTHWSLTKFRLTPWTWELSPFLPINPLLRRQPWRLCDWVAALLLPLWCPFDDHFKTYPWDLGVAPIWRIDGHFRLTRGLWAAPIWRIDGHFKT